MQRDIVGSGFGAEYQGLEVKEWSSVICFQDVGGFGT